MRGGTRRHGQTDDVLEPPPRGEEEAERETLLHGHPRARPGWTVRGEVRPLGGEAEPSGQVRVTSGDRAPCKDVRLPNG